MRWLAHFILRHSLAVIILGMLATAPCIYWTARLYQNVRPDVEELLPRQSRSIQDLSEIRARLQSVANLAVLIFSDDAEGAKRYQIDLAQKLEKLPPQYQAGVEYRIDRRAQVLRPAQGAFVDIPISSRCASSCGPHRVREQLHNPVNIFAERELTEPKLDFRALITKYGSPASSFSRFPDGCMPRPTARNARSSCTSPGQ